MLFDTLKQNSKQKLKNYKKEKFIMNLNSFQLKLKKRRNNYQYCLLKMKNL